jgi:hypothetical protein
MKLTKQEAAEENLDAAIGAFFRGEWVAAIHLAGAAEEVFGRLEEAKGGMTVPDLFWDETDFKDLVATKKEYIKVLNFFRDWIKHYNPGHPPEVEIQEPHVVLGVMRACFAQAAYTQQGRPSVAQFSQWFASNYERIDAMIEAI